MQILYSLAPSLEDDSDFELYVSSSSDSDYNGPYDEYDLAITHARNSKLRECEGAKEFFRVSAMQSLWDENVHKWPQIAARYAKRGDSAFRRRLQGRRLLTTSHL